MNTLFDNARRYERELSGRQRHVLDLIAEGRTNPEIAQALDISLDGAKWHVSEVLTKLGFATREEAAAYWRWRKRPAARLQRVLRAFAAPSLKWLGAGAAGLVAVVALAFGLWAMSSDDDESQPGIVPFVLEAEARVIPDQSDTMDGLPVIVDPSVSQIRWVVRDELHWRWDIERLEPIHEVGTTISWADGEQMFTYKHGSKVLGTAALAGQPITLMPPAMSFFLGPLQPLGIATVDDLLEALRDRSDVAGSAEIIGHDVYLGRDVDVIEFRPAWTSSNSAGDIDTGGSGQLLVDPERMFALVMRLTGGPGTESFEVNVTSLEWDARVSSDDVVYDPPPGLSQGGGSYEGASSAGSSTAWLGSDFPPGMPRPGYIPDGFNVERSSQEGSDIVTWQEVWLAGPWKQSRDYLRVQVINYFDAIPGIADGERVDLGGREGYLEELQEKLRVSWTDGTVLFIVTSRGVERDELLRFAASFP